MANSQRGELAFDAGGKNYTLHYTNNALVELEDQLDMGIVKIVNDMQQWGRDPELIRISRVRALLWAGLLEHHPDVTIESAGNMIQDIGGVGKTLSIIGEAIQKSFSAPEAETKGARPPKPNGIGVGSSSTSPASATIQELSGDILPEK